MHPHDPDEDARPACLPLGAEGIDALIRHRLRGVAVDVAPVVAFTVTYGLTHLVAIALPIALGAGAVAAGYRVLRKEAAWRAGIGLGMVGVAAVLVAATGEATNFFALHVTMHCIVAVLVPVLLLLRWPPFGLALGVLTGTGTVWRRCPVRLRALIRANLAAWCMQTPVLALQLPLYFSGNAVALGAVETFVPFWAATAFFVAWRTYRRTMGTHRCGVDSRGLGVRHASVSAP